MIVKRDGRRVAFDPEKIKLAVLAAMGECGTITNKDYAIVTGIVEYCTAKYADIDVSVEDIQDVVEKRLMASSRKDVAKAYIEHRNKRSKLREANALIEDRLRYMDSYMASTDNAATASETDSNANITVKNVANLEGEVYKTNNREIQRYRMTKKLEEMFPEVASQYVKDINRHIIYIHDEASTPVVKNYCEAVTLYPLLMDGTSTMDGVKAVPPKHLHSYSGQFVNLAFLLAAQCKGAVAFGEFFNFLDYFCAKDFGDNYHETARRVFASARPPMLIIDAIHQTFQEIVYMLNQPAGNRSYQSPFTNISYYDSGYWHALFDDFCFPDGSKPVWERVNWLQKEFMQWFSEERKKTILTFPVETMALLSDGNDIIDKEYKDFTAHMYEEGHSFFTYISDNPNALASCCFSKDTKVLWKSSTKGVNLTTLEDLYNLKWRDGKKNLRIFHNGSWVYGKPIRLDNRKMFKVTTFNNKEFLMTDNHINVTLNGEVTTDKLTTDDYLMFNTMALEAVPEVNEHLTYEMGFVVGAFLGDGSFGSDIAGTIYDINFSQNAQKYMRCMEMVDKCAEQLGIETRSCVNSVYNNVYPVRISSKVMVSFIQRWTLWERGTYAFNKKLNLDCLLQEKDFRRGILDGWYNTDGGNSNRCYTTSKELAEDMEALITSLGYNSIIDVSDRSDEAVVIRDIEYDRHYPLYCVRWYTEATHRANKDTSHSWIKRNNSMYFKIKSIEEVDYTDDVYCIECANQDEPYFTLPSGLITHNCRLRNEIQENTFTFTNGLTGVQTGSVNVITLNINRIVQDYIDVVADGGLVADIKDWDTFYAGFKPYLCNILERVYKYHIAYKTLIYECEKAGMLTASTAGYIRMDKLYSTIGINGHNEAAEFLRMKCNYNEDYKRFINFLTGTISEQNKLHASNKFRFNTELVPAEGLSSKNYNWDKEDGYWVPEDRVLYNSYIYRADDKEISVLDKFRLHGREFTALLDGGVGLHCNLDEHLSKEQYLKLIDFAIKNGTSYFTFNGPMYSCDDCGYIGRTRVDECPKCHSKKLTWWTRIIGYLRPIKCFDKFRRIEAGTRVYSKKESV